MVVSNLPLGLVVTLFVVCWCCVCCLFVVRCFVFMNNIIDIGMCHVSVMLRVATQINPLTHIALLV